MSTLSPSLPVIVIAGYGPSIGESTARVFGSKQFTVACLGRTKSKLDDGVACLRKEGIQAVPFVVDCGQSSDVKRVIQDIRSSMGRISVIVWNAASYSGPDLLSLGNEGQQGENQKDPNSILNDLINVGCAGLLASVQAAYDDLKSSKGSVLVTGGGLSSYDNQVNEMAVNNQWMGLAFCKSSQRKLAGLLHARLKPDHIFVASVIISGKVGRDDDNATSPDEVATCFWELHESRKTDGEEQHEVHLGSFRPLLEANSATQSVL